MHVPGSRALLAALLLLSMPAVGHAKSANVSATLASMLEQVPAPTGVLYDRVLSLSTIKQHDGSRESLPASASEWRQMYDEVWRASIVPPSWPALRAVTSRVPVESGRARLVAMDFAYDRLREDALSSGALQPSGARLVPGAGPVTERARVVAMAILPEHTYRGGELSVRFDAADFLSNDEPLPSTIEVDFADGRGFVPMRFDTDSFVRYASTGEKTIRLRMTWPDGVERYAGGTLDVRALGTPQPDYTMYLTAGISYGGAYGTGEAYVYLAEGHSAITQPVIVLEGFDLDNSMNWDELYALLNREGMLESLRADGFDAVVLNFANAVDYIQRNAFVAVELIEEVRDTAPPGTPTPLVGASMGGLVGRYALAYMETHGKPHPIQNFISFDSPQKGANIPLGIQYWLQFFADDSADAAALLESLDAPAARQMLVYHHTDPPTSGGQADPLRTQFLSDLATVGDYPNQPRKVSIANGSGAQVNQGFIPGEQIIKWEYTSFLIDITGDVWAVPSSSSHLIFHGVVNPIFLPTDEQLVTVSGTRPYDNCPGGWRSSMAQMDATPAPYGDIIALHPNHAFIPSTSALALQTADLFYDIEGDGNILAQTPFDAVYFPTDNQEHVFISPENAAWFLSEIHSIVADVPGAPAPVRPAGIASVEPNPSDAGVTIGLALPSAGAADLAVFDPSGRRVARVEAGDLPAGESKLQWAGTGADGARLAPGVYFLQLSGPGVRATRKVVLR